MSWRRADWLFVVFAITVVAGVSFLPTPKDRNPMVPKTAEHQAVKSEQDCIVCHKSDGVKPLPARHPKRPDCLRCHARQT